MALVDALPVSSASHQEKTDEIIYLEFTRCEKVDRHYFLLAKVTEAYKKRHDSTIWKNQCLEYGATHMDELPTLIPAVIKSSGGLTPTVPTIAFFSTVLAEDGRFQEAIAACEIGILLGLRDGTKSCYEGRIKRITKRSSKEK